MRDVSTFSRPMKTEVSIQYYGHERNAEVVIELGNVNEITYYDPNDIEEI